MKKKLLFLFITIGLFLISTILFLIESNNNGDINFVVQSFVDFFSKFNILNIILLILFGFIFIALGIFKAIYRRKGSKGLFLDIILVLVINLYSILIVGKEILDTFKSFNLIYIISLLLYLSHIGLLIYLLIKDDKKIPLVKADSKSFSSSIYIIPVVILIVLLLILLVYEKGAYLFGSFVNNIINYAFDYNNTWERPKPVIMVLFTIIFISLINIIIKTIKRKRNVFPIGYCIVCMMGLFSFCVKHNDIYNRLSVMIIDGSINTILALFSIFLIFITYIGFIYFFIEAIYNLFDLDEDKNKYIQMDQVSKQNFKNLIATVSSNLDSDNEETDTLEEDEDFGDEFDDIEDDDDFFDEDEEDEDEEDDFDDFDEEDDDDFGDEFDDIEDEDEEDNELDEIEIKAIYSNIKSKTFSQKIITTTDECRDNYIELVKKILEYKLVKKRLSKKADSFRFHKKLIARITLSGKTIRLHLNLNPNDYINERFKVFDLSERNKFVDVPLMFKIRNKRNLIVGLKLIDDLVQKNNLEKYKRKKYEDPLKMIKHRLSYEKKSN